MAKERRERILQIATVVVWVGIIVVGLLWLRHMHVPFRRLPHVLRAMVQAYGMWGPVVILALYVLRSVCFFIPTTVVAIVAGSLYGPFFGTLLNVLGENIAANIGFGVARLLGRKFVRTHENEWIRKYNELLRKEGFLTIIIMRVLYLPFDLVNYGSGLSGMLYRQYALGTLLGVIPPLIILTVLGDTFTNPRAIVSLIVMVPLTLGLALLLRRSQWIRKKLYPEHVHETI